MTIVNGFPVNVVDEIKVSMEQYMPDHAVIPRQVRFMDPARSIGIYVVDWTPDEQSHQIGQQEPALNRYLYRVQNMVKAADEIEGKALFSLDSKLVRVVLYRDLDLHVRLAALDEELMGSREVAKRWGVARQRFLNTELKSQFVYIAQTDFWLESESIQLGAM